MKKYFLLFLLLTSLISTSFAEVDAYPITAEQIRADFVYSANDVNTIKTGLSGYIYEKLIEFSSGSRKQEYSGDSEKLLKQRAQVLSNIITITSEVYGVDPFIFTALIERESLYQYRVASSAGTGLTQFVYWGTRENLEQLGLVEFYHEELKRWKEGYSVEAKEGWEELYHEFENKLASSDLGNLTDFPSLASLRKGLNRFSTGNKKTDRTNRVNWTKKNYIKELPAFASMFGGMYLKTLLKVACKGMNNCEDLAAKSLKGSSSARRSIETYYRIALEKYNGNTKDIKFKENCSIPNKKKGEVAVKSVMDCYGVEIIKNSRKIMSHVEKSADSLKELLERNRVLESSVDLFISNYLLPNVSFKNKLKRIDSRFLSYINYLGKGNYDEALVKENCSKGKSLYLTLGKDYIENGGAEFRVDYEVTLLDCSSFLNGDSLSSLNYQKVDMSFHYDIVRKALSAFNVSGIDQWRSSSYGKNDDETHEVRTQKIFTLLEKMLRVDDSIGKVYGRDNCEWSHVECAENLWEYNIDIGPVTYERKSDSIIMALQYNVELLENKTLKSITLIDD